MTEWVPIGKAVTMLSAITGSDHSAKLMIADRLRDLHFTARALVSEEYRFLTFTPTPDSPKRRGSAVERATREPTVLDSTFWRRTTQWEGDQNEWDWGLGVIFVTIAKAKDHQPARLLVGRQTEIRRAELDAAIGISKGAGKSAIRSIARSRATEDLPTKYDWEQVLIDFGVEITEFGGFERRFGDPFIRGAQAKIVRWLTKRAAVYGLFTEPSSAEAKKRAKPIIIAYQALKSRKSVKKL